MGMGIGFGHDRNGSMGRMGKGIFPIGIPRGGKIPPAPLDTAPSVIRRPRSGETKLHFRRELEVGKFGECGETLSAGIGIGGCGEE